jgi:hypothetical protein
MQLVMQLFGVLPLVSGPSPQRRRALYRVIDPRLGLVHGQPARSISLDHLISASEQQGRHSETERFGSLHIDR